MKDNILIISNAALANSDSNGRTLLKLVSDLPDDNLAHFFTYGVPDGKNTIRSYKISDSDALKSFIKRQKKDGRFSETISTPVTSGKKRKKTPLRMLAREFVWKHGCWNNSYFKNWVDEVDPKCIILAVADNCFLLNIACKIAKERNIPIIVYSTEEYQFKDYNYQTKRFSLLYLLFRKKLVRAYKILAKYVKAGVFNTEALADLYFKEYGYECRAIYNTSDIDWLENYRLHKIPRVSYLGNLGLNRHKALIEVATAINNICPGAKLDIYGKLKNDDVKTELENCPYVSLKGFVPYDEVKKVMHISDLLIHVEYRDDFYVRDLKYAFSTKIADSISSGTPLLMYAPVELIETDFLIEKKCAFVATNKDGLGEQLKAALTDEKLRKVILRNALSIRNDLFTATGVFKKIVEEVIRESNPD